MRYRVKIFFGLLKIKVKMCKLIARDFNATSLYTFSFSTLYTTLLHNLIEDKRIALIERTFNGEGSSDLACNDRNAFLLRKNLKKISCMVLPKCMQCADLFVRQHVIQFGTKLYRQVVWIPMGTNFAPLIADLLLFCYEGDLMMSLSDEKQTDIIDAFNTTSRYLDDILNIGNVYSDNMVSQIYPSALQLLKLIPLVPMKPKPA